jgi:hypothetical protein
VRDTRGLLAEIRGYLGAGSRVPVCFELPDFGRVLRERAFWDIYYEHCSYFTASSLARLFRSSGFEILDLRTVYGDQYLVVEARLGDDGVCSGSDDVEAIEKEVLSFVSDCTATLEQWRADVDGWRKDGLRVALWGSGSKAVGFLTTLGLTDEVSCVVDINPLKRGKYMPGCEPQIVDPKALRDVRPDVVVVMNAVYQEEIGRDLAALGLSPRVVALS